MLKFIKEKEKIILSIIGSLVAIGLICVCSLKWYEIMKEREVENYPFTIMKHEASLSYSEYKSRLVKEVQHYIDSVAPSSTMTGYSIVEMSEKYDLDIKFVLAQGQLESHFGTTGMAVKTNSVFNVGAYDNKKCSEINGKYKYKHPDFSIEPYMQLLYKDYITGSKTELDLMGKYISKAGKRYSSNMNYENELIALYKKIKDTTDISMLQGELRRYRIICGI